MGVVGVEGGDWGTGSGGIVSGGIDVPGEDGGDVVLVVVALLRPATMVEVVPLVRGTVAPVETKVAVTPLSTLSSTLTTAPRRACSSSATSPQSAPSDRKLNAFDHRFAKSPLPASAIDAPTTVSPTDRVESTNESSNPCTVRNGGTTLVMKAAFASGVGSAAVSARDRRASCVPRSIASPR